MRPLEPNELGMSVSLVPSERELRYLDALQDLGVGLLDALRRLGELMQREPLEERELGGEG